MLNVCETLIANVKNNLVQNKRSNGELKAKLQELFEDNIAYYDKLANWYDESKPTIDVIGKDEFEHYIVEDFKKLVYGDDYEVKKYKW